MKLVYQIGWQELAVSILGIYAPILFVIIAFLYVRFMRKYKNSNDPREKYRPIMEKIVKIYLLILCAIMHIISVFSCKTEYTNVYRAYKDGNYESVYGGLV